jgi:copper chaperone CopZ
MQTTSFAVPDISSDGCADAIRTALRGLNTAYDVDVDGRPGIVAVSHGVTSESVANALGRAGFPRPSPGRPTFDGKNGSGIASMRRAAAALLGGYVAWRWPEPYERS